MEIMAVTGSPKPSKRKTAPSPRVRWERRNHQAPLPQQQLSLLPAKLKPARLGASDQEQAARSTQHNHDEPVQEKF